jgi:hypothetical protein
MEKQSNFFVFGLKPEDEASYKMYGNICAICWCPLLFISIFINLVSDTQDVLYCKFIIGSNPIYA